MKGDSRSAKEQFAGVDQKVEQSAFIHSRTAMKADPSVVQQFAPTGVLRASLNMGNPVLAHSRTACE